MNLLLTFRDYYIFDVLNIFDFLKIFIISWSNEILKPMKFCSEMYVLYVFKDINSCKGNSEHWSELPTYIAVRTFVNL